MSATSFATLDQAFWRLEIEGATGCQGRTDQEKAKSAGGRETVGVPKLPEEGNRSDQTSRDGLRPPG